MKKIIQIIFIFLFFGNIGFAQTLLLQESFESGATNYDANTFDDLGSDYFDVFTIGTLHNASYIPSSIYGSYFMAAEDCDATDNPLGTESCYIVLSSLDVSAYSQVQVTIALAALNGGTFEYNLGNSDFLDIEYAFDGNIATAGDAFVNTGTYTTIGSFRPMDPALNGGADSSPTLYVDTDSDSYGDGTGLTNAFQDFTFTTSVTGTNVSIRIKIYNPNPSEELAVDNIRVYGVGIASTAPTVTTSAASGISTTSATLGGNVTADGGASVTERGVVYSTSDATPTIAEGASQDANGSGTGIFFESIGSLNPNTTYYYNAYAINSEGTSYGTAGNFTTQPLAATVTTQAVTSITQSTATGNGNITRLGDPNPTAHGVCWNTGGTPTTADSKTDDGAVSATGAFTSSITSLSPNTTYYVRTYVTNAAGTSYGSQVSFTTDPEAPTVTTQAVSAIGMSTATGNGNITDLGSPNPTAHGICWSTLENPTTADSKDDKGAASATGAFTASITSLSPNTTYYVRAFATNTAGTSYGTQVSFTTDPEPATVITQAVSAITKTSVTLNGNITDLGVPNPTQHGFCMNTSGNPTLANYYTEKGAASAIGAYSSDVNSLNPNTTYYVRAYAINSAGTVYGSQVSYTTLPQEPTVTTQAVSAIAQTTATGNGNITDLGSPNPTQHGVCWSTSENPTTVDSKTEEGVASTTGAFTSSITSLSPNTTYYVRAYAINTAGTTYGAQVSFISDPEPATVTTQAVTDIGMTTATGNGNVTSLGYPNPTQHGVCWNTGGTPTTADNKTDDGAVSATGAFTSSITSLSPNTTYYVRTYVTNAAGTTYGTEVSFTTDPEPPTVTTQAITSIAQTTATGNGNITDLGIPNPAQYGVCWSTSENPTTVDSKTEEGAVSTTGAFTSSITGLNPNTTYYVRAYATNTAGTSYGSQVVFTTLPSLATATTQAVTNISKTSATGNGNITSLGAPNPTQHGVCWNTSGNPMLSDNYTEEGAVSATGAYTSNITGLSPNTTYYTRAYVKNLAGTTYGVVVSFTTLPELPVCTTDAANTITSTGAILNGTINANNQSTTVTFEYGLTTGYGTTVTADQSPVTGVSNTPVDKAITSLLPNTTYHYRVVGVNATGKTNGADQTFTTLAVVPTVTTQAVTNIAQTTATGNGNITDLGVPNPTQHGVCWNTGGTPTIGDSKAEEGAVSATGVFTSSITELSPNTTYYVRSYATNTAGTSYGEEVSFVTLPVEASVATQAVTNIAQTTATGNGSITDLGVPNPTQHGVCWNTGGTPTIGDSKTEEGAVSATGAFTSTIASLNSNTTYYVRAYATNTAGTSYGDEVSFTTLPVEASVTTQAVTNIAQTTATGNGNITDLGVPNPTQYGVCWNTSGNPMLSDNYTEEGVVSATGAFTSSITELSPNTTYYVRAYASNTAGTSYGDEVSFTTLPVEASVTTQAVTNIAQTTATGNGNITYLGVPNPTQHGVCWNTGGTPTIGDSKTEEGAVSATGAFTSTIASLNSNTTYYVRAYATNTAGTSYGEEVSFTTLPLEASVATGEASEIEPTEVVLNGIINANGLSTDVRFEYGLTTDYGNSVTADQSPVTGTTDVNVNVSIAGLKPNTTYHFRVVGENSEATAYGNDKEFTTIKYDQVITFAELLSKTTDDIDFDPGAISDLGLKISYESSNELVATIVDDLIHIVGVGTTDIVAYQAGNDTVNVATPVSQNFTVTEGTGIETADLSNIKVYPNPAHGYLNIEIIENASVSIIDMNGRTVISKNLTNSVSKINVSKLNSGLYIVEIKTSVYTRTLKLIIE